MNDATKIPLVKCLYSRQWIKKEDAIKFGGFISCGHDFWYSKEFKDQHKVSRKLFDMTEQNCNTCIHLERIQHPKSPYGNLYGKCKSVPINHPYQDSDQIMFYPEDPMHMKCYEPRSPLSPEEEKMIFP